MWSLLMRIHLFNPSHGGFSNFFPTGTYAGIGTMCVEFENVIKSATKKKIQSIIELTPTPT